MHKIGRAAKPSSAMHFGRITRAEGAAWFVDWQHVKRPDGQR
jgi:hypothetical protein